MFVEIGSIIIILLIIALFIIGCATIYFIGKFLAGSFYRFILILLIPLSILFGVQIFGFFGFIIGVGVATILFFLQLIEEQRLFEKNELEFNENLNPETGNKIEKYIKYKVDCHDILSKNKDDKNLQKNKKSDFFNTLVILFPFLVFFFFIFIIYIQLIYH